MARTLVTAGTIYAGDPPRAAGAMVLDDGRITWVGAAGAAPKPIPRAKIDFGDSALIPGLIDSHQHMSRVAWITGWVDCRDCRSPGDALERLRAHAPAVPEGLWIVGWGYNVAEAKGTRRVTRQDLDTVSTDRPVMLAESSFHQGCANSAALAAVGWGRDMPRWWGGELERTRSGEPTGMAWEKAFSVLDRAARRAEWEVFGTSVVERVRAVANQRLAEGLTHLGEALADPTDIAIFRDAALPLGVTLMPASDRAYLAAPWDALDGPRTGDGDARLGFGPLKLFADGAERAAFSLTIPRTMRQMKTMLSRAWSSRDPAGLRVMTSAKASLHRGSLVSGTLHYPPEAMADLIAAALAKGFQVAVHALGNLGVRSAIDALEEARRRTDIDVAGCRIEHAMFIEGRDIDRAATLGLILSMQPGHAVHYARTLIVTGIDQVLDPVPLRRVLDAGCRLAISSDGPTAPGTALENMRAAVDRRTRSGEVIRGDLAITREEALRAATLGGAEACGVAEVKGSLEPGKQADFAALSGDPFDPSTAVLATWIAGRPVWPASSKVT